MRTLRRRVLISISSFLLAMIVMSSTYALAARDKTLHAFSSQPRGALPVSLVQDATGNLFGATQFGGAFNAGTVFELSPGADGKWAETVLHSFGGGSDGRMPLLILLDSQGNIYGTTASGGSGCTISACGTVFQMTRNSNGAWMESVIYNFHTGDGYPTGALVIDNAGNLYGAMSNFLAAQFSVFQLTPSGGSWNKSIVYTFAGGSQYDVAIPGLVLDATGNIFGTLTSAASAPNGLVFELSPSSAGHWNETTLYAFAGGSSGAVPTAGLFLQNGILYGTTGQGGISGCDYGCGTVFALSRGSNGQWTEQSIYAFIGTPGQPVHPSLGGFDPSGNLYGFTENGGAGICPYCGSVFQLVPDSFGGWTESDLWDFGGRGSFPTSLLLDPAGQLYGTNLGPDDIFPTQGKVFELRANSGQWLLKTLYRFPTTDGQNPVGGLVQDAAGNLYGTTVYGGLNNVGAIFKLSPASNGWKESLLYSFTPPSNELYFSVGPSPLIADTKGNLYGTTQFGGKNNFGAVFQASLQADGSWKVTNLFSFKGQAEPTGGVVLDQAGNLYGVTHQSGTQGAGTAFKLTQNASGVWEETVIHNFGTIPDDGNYPVGGLTMDANGNLYGTTQNGGAGSCSMGARQGCGTVFELSYSASGGWTETILYSFLGTRAGDGTSPITNLIFDGSGNLYGTTIAGGINNATCFNLGYGLGCGTVFELSPSATGWNETILYEFSGGLDAFGPAGPLVFDPLGNLYGTVEYQAANDFGGLFKLTPSAGGSWQESLFYVFGTGTDGRFPVGGLIFGASGKLLGVTAGGGVGGSPDNNGQGTAFEIAP